MHTSPLQKHIHLQPHEVVRMAVHKHWFIFFQSALRLALLATLPFILLAFLAPSVKIDPQVPTFLVSLWMLSMWLALFTAWTNYRLDMWVVTDRRIVNINQIGLFAREVSTLRIERVQDIQVERYGLLANIFDFGDIKIQNAGPDARDYEIQGVPHPQDIRDAMLKCVDSTTEHPHPQKERK